MARSKKGSRRIMFDGVPYRWRARGDDGDISVTVWPEEGNGPQIEARFGYDETFVDRGAGVFSSAGDQVVVTNRIVRRVVNVAVKQHGYGPASKGGNVILRDASKLIDMSDAVRASGGGGSSDGAGAGGATE